MPCVSPLFAYRRFAEAKNGKWPLTFNIKDGIKELEVKIPCGQCVECRLEKSRQWAIRCVNEASLNSNNVFVTLTYNNENVPENKSLSKKVVQLFIKRLRKKYKKEKIRYYAAGEYGEELERPHYHMCIFGFDFPDKYLYTVREGVKLYRSQQLESLWPFGFSTIGDVTWESAAYVARYVTKKITGEIADNHYKGRLPEFSLMSRKPGIGKEWWNKWKNDVKAIDKVIVRNDLQIMPPRYYNSIWEKEEPEIYKKVKERRIENVVDRSFSDLSYLKKVKEFKARKLKRRFENVKICSGV